MLVPPTAIVQTHHMVTPVSATMIITRPVLTFRGDALQVLPFLLSSKT